MKIAVGLDSITMVCLGDIVGGNVFVSVSVVWLVAVEDSINVLFTVSVTLVEFSLIN